MSSSDPICQFYLRGRCQRQNCEFKHANPNNRIQICRFFQSTGHCRYESKCKFRHESPIIISTFSLNSENESHKNEENENEERNSFILQDTENSEISLNEKDTERSVTTFEEKRNEILSIETNKNQETSTTHNNEIPKAIQKKSIIAVLSKEWDEEDEEENESKVSKSKNESEESSSKNECLLNESTSTKINTSEEVCSTEDNDNNDEKKDENESESKNDSETSSSRTIEQEEKMEEETIESIENFISGEEKNSLTSETSKSNSTPGVDNEMNEDEWVTLIFGEDGKPKDNNSVYDLNPDGADFSGSSVESPVVHSSYGRKREKSRGASTKSHLSKKDGVTKIGNNVYFYSGPNNEFGSNDDDDDDHDHDVNDDDANDDADYHHEDDWEESSKTIEEPPPPPTKRKKYKTSVRSYVYGAHALAAKIRRCGECENCTKEDCGTCDSCKDFPKNGGPGAKKKACIHRVCLWKNPSGSKSVKNGRGRGRKTDGKRGRMSLPVIAPGTTNERKQPVCKRRRSNESVEPLPVFDPEKFKPGYVPPVIKKGDNEYHVVVTGVKDTGLCGKYWSDTDALPARRRTRHDETDVNTKSKNSSIKHSGDTNEGSTPLRGPRKSISKLEKKKHSPTAAAASPRSKRNKVEFEDSESSLVENEEEEIDECPKDKSPEISIKPESKNQNEPLSRSRSVPLSRNSDILLTSSSSSTTVSSSKSLSSCSSTTTTTTSSTPTSSSSNSLTNRSVSCVADTSTQREVVVECFAPYDDHRWVNIGKERDNMAPSAVQYARALRPPYHLLSFLRIKGHSTKGMSCTDKNTMVFVVLEGEITVVLHTTQFNAKKGDSFYIPPKNYYNLINQKAREAELSLIQFQYDGPLPTVSANSQSGTQKSNEERK